MCGVFMQNFRKIDVLWRTMYSDSLKDDIKSNGNINFVKYYKELSAIF